MNLFDGGGNNITVRVAIPNLLDIHFAVESMTVTQGYWAWYPCTNYRGNGNLIFVRGVARTESARLVSSTAVCGL